MLNQVILIGRVVDTQVSDTGLVQKIILNVTTGTNTDRIAIDIDQKMALYGPFNENNILAIKARISSKDANAYSIVADRITLLGGINRGT